MEDGRGRKWERTSHDDSIFPPLPSFYLSSVPPFSSCPFPSLFPPALSPICLCFSVFLPSCLSLTVYCFPLLLHSRLWISSIPVKGNVKRSVVSSALSLVTRTSKLPQQQQQILTHLFNPHFLFHFLFAEWIKNFD